MKAEIKTREIRKNIKKHAKRRQRLQFERLKNEIRQGPLRDAEFRVSRNPASKMSDALVKLAEPFIDETRNEDEYRTLLSMAAVAWNVTLVVHHI